MKVIKFPATPSADADVGVLERAATVWVTTPTPDDRYRRYAFKGRRLTQYEMLQEARLRLDRLRSMQGKE